MLHNTGQVYRGIDMVYGGDREPQGHFQKSKIHYFREMLLKNLTFEPKTHLGEMLKVMGDG